VQKKNIPKYVESYLLIENRLLHSTQACFYVPEIASEPLWLLIYKTWYDN